MTLPRRLPATPAALLLLLGLAWLAYLPGLSGGFLFDDFINLPALGATGPVDDRATFWRYLTSGTADPTGRPLALLSFLLDARHWPADPAPFLRTNVLLHLLNGALLFVLLRALGARLDGAGRLTDAAALLGAGLWLLHPLLVSTTLYIVQREAMLPATFVLLGLLAWLHGHGLMASRPRAATAWMVLGIGLGTALAMLAKANGILLPLLAWVLDATVLRDGATPPEAARRRLRALRIALLAVPSAVVFAYLLWHVPRIGEVLNGRDWTLGERLLTEPRVLLDYLRLMVVPRVLSTGLYNDDYLASAGWLQPGTTLPALLAVLALAGAGFALRRRMPALAAGLLFFFAGHLLESTILPLELYFEHRNYLPAMLLGWPLARAVARWRAAPGLRMGIAVGMLGLLALVTWQRAALWGQPDRMALLWAAQHPDSSRAQATAASIEIRNGLAPQAMARLGPRWQQHPHDLQLALNYASAACVARGLSAAEADAVGRALRHADEGDQLVHRWLARALSLAASGACPGMDVATVAAWLDAAHANPKLQARAGRRQELHSAAGQLALLRHQPDQALAAFDRALAEDPRPEVAMAQAGMLATQGHYRQALAHLDGFERLPPRPATTRRGMARLHGHVLARQGYWPRELALLRGKLRDALDAAPVRPAPPSR
jgi:tetratricopeptide (TPR) repeat protein